MTHYPWTGLPAEDLEWIAATRMGEQAERAAPDLAGAPIWAKRDAAIAEVVAAAARVLYQNQGLSTTSTSDVSLASYTVPANALAANGQALRITVTGQVVTQGGVLTFLFGAAALWSASLTVGEAFVITITLVRTGAGTQVSHTVQLKSPSVVNVYRTTAAETLSGPVLLDFQGRVTSGGTLSFDGITVERVAA